MVDIAKAGHHVADSNYFDLPSALGGHWNIPPLDVFGHQFVITKFMVLELVAAALMVALFVPLAWKVRKGQPPRGKFWNALESVLVFLRDEVARPAIGAHDADRFLPFLWNTFFFILFCNLLGMLPWAGSPTGALAVTGVMALMAFCTVTGAGMAKYGAGGFWVGLVPHMDVPKIMALPLFLLMFGIEVIGLCIRHTILAIRLLANMFAGHLVLAVILGFIAEFAGSWLWYGVAPVSVLGATALSMLELFVAFLQAYIFTFLSALFIGMAVHQH